MEIPSDRYVIAAYMLLLYINLLGPFGFNYTESITLSDKIGYSWHIENRTFYVSVKDINVWEKVQFESISSLQEFKEYKIQVFDDEFCFKLIDDHYDEYQFVKEFPVGVMKSDFCRYLIIYHYGGVYVDSDVVVYKNPENWMQTILKGPTGLIVGLESLTFENYSKYYFCGPYQIVQWSFAALPKHPVLLHVIEIISEKYKADKKQFENPHAAVPLTGPCVMTQAIDSHVKEHNKTIEALINAPAKIGDVYIGPVHQFNCGQKYDGIYYECSNRYTVLKHLYAGRWK
eukprot:NODE_7_length_67686_cov_1.621421.p21 type:complete len:287 gc:universal NODE_7_length_67686_cov_1.621421:43943-44803(+)